MEHSTYARCHKFPPNSDSTLETDEKNKGGETIGREREDGVNWRGIDAMQDATRQGKILSFFLMKRKESCARKGGGGEKERRGEGKGGSV